MGSLTPLGDVRCPMSWLVGVAVFTSVLMITCLLKRALRNRYQLRRLSGLRLIHTDNFQFFLHLRNFDVLQHLLDAFIHLAQRLANCASIGLIAFAANGYARSNEQRAVNG